MMDKETALRVKYCGMKQSKLAKVVIQLEKEADWLASKCEVMSKFVPFIPVSKDEFREEARKALSDD